MFLVIHKFLFILSQKVFRKTGFYNCTSERGQFFLRCRKTISDIHKDHSHYQLSRLRGQ